MVFALVGVEKLIFLVLQRKREMEIRRQSNKREEGMGVTTGHEETTTTVDWGGRPVTLRSMVG